MRAQPSGKPWEDRLVDLRVEDSPDPLGELRRLLVLHRAYQHMNAGDLSTEKNDLKGASVEYGAAEALVPDSAEMLFWHAITMAGAGQLEAAKPLLARAYALDPNWRTLVERLPRASLLPDDPKLVRQLVEIPPQASRASRR